MVPDPSTDLKLVTWSSDKVVHFLMGDAHIASCDSDETDNEAEDDDYFSVKEGAFSSVVGDHVERIIVQSYDYIIYLDKRLHVSVTGDVEYPPGYARVANKVWALQSTPCEHLTSAQIENLRMYCGYAIARILDDKDPEAAIEAVQQGWDYYRERSAEVSRRWYLESGGSAFVVLLILSMIAALNRDLVSNRAEYAEIIYFSVCMGGMGSFVSIVLRLGSICPDPSGGRWLHSLEAFARMIIGCLSGLLVVICLLSGTVFSLVTSDDALTSPSPAFYFALILSLASGLSERTIPTIVNRISADGSGIESVASSDRSPSKVHENRPEQRMDPSAPNSTGDEQIVKDENQDQIATRGSPPVHQPR